MMDENRTVLIAGTGAMACLFGARLVEIGADVIHLGTWTEGLQALREDGIHLLAGSSAERSLSGQGDHRPAGCPGGEIRPGAGQILADGAGRTTARPHAWLRMGWL